MKCWPVEYYGIDVDMQGGSISHPVRRTLSDVNKGFSGVGYYIPSDNPFVDTNGGLFEEYYTLGSRNPHRMTVDRETGIIYVGNAGSNGENHSGRSYILEKKETMAGLQGRHDRSS